MEVTQLQPVGSSEGCVLLLANSSLLLSLSLDLEFNRVAVGLCLSVEPSLDEMRDNLLPPRAGSVVDCVFSSPLFLQLCHDGNVCILSCRVSSRNSLTFSHFSREYASFKMPYELHIGNRRKYAVVCFGRLCHYLIVLHQ